MIVFTRLLGLAFLLSASSLLATEDPVETLVAAIESGNNQEAKRLSASNRQQLAGIFTHLLATRDSQSALLISHELFNLGIIPSDAEIQGPLASQTAFLQAYRYHQADLHLQREMRRAGRGSLSRWH